MTWLKVCVLSLLLGSQGFSSDWNFSPLRDQEGNIFVHGGGIERIIDLTFSEELDVFIIALKTNDSSLVVATSEDAQRWEIVSAEYWTWGYTSGKLKNHNGALLLLIGNGIFRWDYSTWTRSRIDQFEGRLDSLAASPTTVVTAYSSTGTVYNSTDGGINYTPGIAAAGLSHVESIGDEFYAFHWSSTRDDVLMHSTDGSYFSVLEALPEHTGFWKCIGKVGDKMILIRDGFDFSANTGKYEVLSREPSGVYRSLGFYNKTPSSQMGSWPERYLITDRGGIFTTSQNGILEFSNQGGVLNFTVHEEARMKLEWRGVASGNGISVLATKTGMLAIADFDLVGEGPPNPSNLTYTTTNGEVTITDCDEAATGELVIPTTIEGNPVTSIGDYAFRDCVSLTSITIPDSVTSIGLLAFSNCTVLTSITIPVGVTSIENGTFSGCTSLKSITIPESVTSIDFAAFNGCANLTSITIPDGVTSIDQFAFKDCTSLTNVSFQGVAPTMGPTVFVGVPEGVKAYVRYEFADSFGGFGNAWEGLTVAIQRATITYCGFVNATTFCIEFEPAGVGYRVMSSPTLDFGNAVEVTPTLQPTSGSDNRFELTPDGSRKFYRLEPKFGPEFIFVAAGSLPESSWAGAQSVDAFYMAKTEVTWAIFQEVRTWAAANGYDIGSAGDLRCSLLIHPRCARDGVTYSNYPVDAVSWHQALKWCNAWSEKEGLDPVYKTNGAVYRSGDVVPSVNATANGYRLPSEKEWEFAARGGVQTNGYEYSGSNDINAVAWHWGNSNSMQNVATKQANELGIHDMSGNVWEFCFDLFPWSTKYGMYRGGDWQGGDTCRVAWRYPPHNWPISGPGIGFRVARSLVPAATGFAITDDVEEAGGE